jgi:hypothetical protein
MTAVLDIRTYELEPGAEEHFDRLFREGALPLLEEFGIDVVASGTSAAGDGRRFLIRGFSSLEERTSQLDSFYGSKQWRRNYSDLVSRLISDYHVVVVELTPEVREAFAALGLNRTPAA